MVAFELFLLIAIGIVVATLVGIAIWRHGELPKRPPTKELKMLKEAWEDQATLGGFIGPEAGLLLITVGLSANGSTGLRTSLWIAGAVIGATALLAMIFRVPPKGSSPDEYSAWRTTLKDLGEAIGTDGLQWLAIVLLLAAVIAAIFLLPLLQGTILLAGTVMIYAGPFVNWPDRGDSSFGRLLLRSGGFWTAVAASTAIALAAVATPPVGFTRATVESLDGSNSRSGAYLDRGDGGVYLGLCTPDDIHGGRQVSTHARIHFLPAEEGEHLELGGDGYRFDPGGRPSIWQTLVATFGSGSAAAENAPLHHSLRGQATYACGSRRPDGSKATIAAGR